MRDTREREIRRQRILATTEQQRQFELEIQEFQRQREEFVRLRRSNRDQTEHRTQEAEKERKTASGKQIRDIPGFEKQGEESDIEHVISEPTGAQTRLYQYPLESSRRLRSASSEVDGLEERHTISATNVKQSKQETSELQKLQVELEEQSQSLLDIERRMEDLKLKETKDSETEVPRGSRVKSGEKDYVKSKIQTSPLVEVPRVARNIRDLEDRYEGLPQVMSKLVDSDGSDWSGDRKIRKDRSGICRDKVWKLYDVKPERDKYPLEIELGRKREQWMKSQEDQIRLREMELEIKSEELVKQEKLISHTKEHEVYEAKLNKREQDIRNKLQELAEKEENLKRREDHLRISTRMHEVAAVDETPHSVRHEEYQGFHGQQSLYPKFSIFSGEEPKPKNEATFEEWQYEVNCTRQYNTYPEFVLAQALRKSLRGQAKRVLLPMGTTATSDEMIRKLEGVFGNVTAGESVLQEFYTTSQRQEETVAAWGLRLEEILQKAVDKGHVPEEKRNEMLRTKFWKSLHSEKLKLSTRICYETIPQFEELRKKIRAEEYEMQTTHVVRHRPIQATSQEDKLDQMMKKITSLEQQMQQLSRGEQRTQTGTSNEQSTRGAYNSRPKRGGLNGRGPPSQGR